MNYQTVAYVLIVGLTGAVLLLWLWRRLRKIEGIRKKRVKGFKSFDAVPTESPQDDHTREARQQSLQNIETRFAIFKRILLPALLGLFLLLLIIPFLDTLPKTIVSLVIAVVTVVVGIAARPFIENLIAGVVISFGKRIRVGDTVVIDEHYGTIEDINLTYTTLKEWDWSRYIIPNLAMLNRTVVNHTLADKYRWVKIEFWVDYDSDLELIEQLAAKAVKSSPNFVEYESPKFWVIDLTKEAAYCVVIAWTDNPSQAWMLGVDIRRELIRLFQAHGIKSHSFRYKLNEKSNHC